MRQRGDRKAAGAAKAGKQSRFDIDILRKLAGDKVFARGEEYHEHDQVELLAIEPDRVLAQVSGSMEYRTELNGRGKNIGGRCSCPAYADWGFCKHMVAVGLAANAAGDAEGTGGSLSRIRDHLKTKSVDFLTDMIVQLAERDSRLFRSLELAAVTSQSDDATLEARLRKAIDGATRTGAYIDYSSAPDWAAGVDAALDAIEEIASGARAEIALKFAERAFDRIERATESIDDSDGYCGALLSRAQEIHLTAASAARPEPVQLARDLFAREMNDQYDIFYGAAELYAEVLGERGLAEYRRLAADAWQKVQPRSRHSHQESPVNSSQLVSILDFFAERDGDLDTRIALRAKDLSSPYDYLRLAEFCLAQGRREQAIKYAEEGLWVFEDGRQEERLVLFAADLFAKSGRAKDAEAHLWTAFDKMPSRDLYTRLRRIGGDVARTRALQLLEAQCAKGDGIGRRSSADLLVEILLQEKAFDEAWTALRKFGGSPGLRERLARATEKTHPGEAIEVYEACVDRLAGSGAYEEATKLVARLAKLRSVTAQASYVAALKERHGRKRNFMKLLG